MLLKRAFQEMLHVFGRPRNASSDDERALVQHLPALERLESEASRSEAILAARYEHYVRNVSHAVWAVSLESASAMHAFCTITRPGKVLDLGSGFSSAVFRLYARDTPGCIVHSVDDDAQWLKRTREYLEETDLSTGGLQLWSDFQASSGQYDFIFHDMGRMALRASSLPFVFARLAPGGLLALDDMHKEPYATTARSECAAAGLRVFSLRGVTLDDFGRYACLAAR
jgi:predicted O-methyltransferase YrrM